MDTKKFKVGQLVVPIDPIIDGGNILLFKVLEIVHDNRKGDLYRCIKHTQSINNNIYDGFNKALFSEHEIEDLNKSRITSIGYIKYLTQQFDNIYKLASDTIVQKRGVLV